MAADCHADGSSVTGRLLSVDGDAALLDAGGHDRSLAIAGVARAVVQVEFARGDEEG